MQIHVDENKRVWLSYEYLKSVGISEGTIKAWIVRGSGSRQYIDKRAFLDYDTIPNETRKRLYGKGTLMYDARQERLSTRENLFFNQLDQAFTGIASAKWRNLIQDAYPKLDVDCLTKFSRRAAVIEKALDLNPYLHSNLECLFKAYLRIYNGAYSTKKRFSMMLSEAREKGILHVAVDKRVMNNPKPIHGDVIQFWAAYILNHNKAYTLAMSYELLAETCEKNGVKTPSYNWFRRFYAKHKNTLSQNRYGQSEFEKLNQNYAKIIPALNAGDQWQMDGWRIPIYCKKYQDDKTVQYVTYNLFTVLDAHSRKIIGYCISESENTQSILKGIDNAVKETLILPFEIVADNHSFNKTKEAGNIKEEMERMGVTWTIDSNPRRKAIQERAFRTLGEKFFKKQYGYIGQGIKSKMQGGITQQELRDKYTERDNFLVFEQVVALTCLVIQQYNSTRIKFLKDSPNSLYQKSEQPNAIKVSDFQRLQLFTLKSEYKISHGQITMARGAHRYEYQLPAEYAQPYNNQTVSVRYADYDTIYLYNSKTDEPICSVDKKFAIHGALANQTEKDKELLFKNKGRANGIDTRAKKKKMQLCSNAIINDPNAYEAVNRITTQMDITELLRTDYELRKSVWAQDVNPDTVQELPKIDEMLDKSMKPQIQKENPHPFQAAEGSMKKTKVDFYI